MTQSNIVLHSTDNWPLGRALNSLAEECGSWWQAVLADRKCVISTGCDEEVVVRLGGNELLRARIVQGRVDVHVPEEYLYLSHPGYRVVLRAGEETNLAGGLCLWLTLGAIFARFAGMFCTRQSDAARSRIGFGCDMTVSGA